jgi:[glutamine synthetase] adenylyltransferase / [glutamine synthetase]-adenylyl-L-tyrosine phosphorylase
MDNPTDMARGDVRALLLARRLEPHRAAALLRPYGFRDPLAADRELQAMAEDPGVRRRLAAILPGLLEGLGASADPDGALRRLERFFRAAGNASAVLGHLAADPRLIDVLTVAFGASPFMAEILTRHPAWLYWLSEPDVLDRARTRKEMRASLRASLAPLRTEESRLDALRLAKRQEILHIGVRDLLRRSTVEETVRALSVLADTLIEAAGAIAEEALRTSLGLAAGKPQVAGFTVLGLGKLGGDELNFSSDVDLVYLYRSDDGRMSRAASAPARGDYFQALARRLTSVLGSVTGEGHVYRVDLRLRPEGRAGAVAHSLRAMEEYYRHRGATWERLALLKARPVAGDRALGKRFAQRVASFIYGRPFDAAALDEIRRLKRQVDGRIAQRSESHRHVKLGVGGIREIELACQVLQVRFGNRRPRLRRRGSLAALEALREERLLAGPEHDALRGAYLFLRDVENKLQMVADTQVHALPEGPEETRACALRLGYRCPPGQAPEDALMADYRRHTDAVHRIFEDVLAGPRLA